MLCGETIAEQFQCSLLFLCQVDKGRGAKPIGYYVQHSGGLFPAPLPQTDYADMQRVETLFNFMGSLFAKCIQDGRLVDIPLSRPLLKMMCGGDSADALSQMRSAAFYTQCSNDDDLTPTEPMMPTPMTPW
jgi:E3 ubiquitin-protein ligase HECTD1